MTQDRYMSRGQVHPEVAELLLDRRYQKRRINVDSSAWILKNCSAVGGRGSNPATNGLTPRRSQWLPIDPVIICAASGYVAY
jgi:hypothetical protein